MSAALMGQVSEVITRAIGRSDWKGRNEESRKKN